MSNADFLQPNTPVQDVYTGGNYDPPRTSLDFVIRQSGLELDDKYLRIQTFSGQDSVNELFEYQVSFRANDLASSERDSNDIDFAKVVGSSATIRLGLPEGTNVGSYPDPAYVSFFNGIVSDISLQQSGSYSCTIRPQLWQLTLVNDYCHFSQMTIKEVIESIVKNKWQLDCDLDGLGSLATYRVQDWMQMGETDWAFIASLLHEVGGYFYFIHDDVSHTVVFANNPNRTPYYVNLPPAGSTDTHEILPVYYTFSNQVSFDEDDYLLSFSYQQTQTASGTRNIIGEPQAAWEENQAADLHIYSDGVDDNDVFQRYRLFQYGVTQELTSSLNKEDTWSVASQGFRLSGECSSSKFKSGHMFEAKLAKAGCSRPDVCLMRPELDGQQFVIMSVSHQANVDGRYTNKFTAAPAKANVHELSPSSTHIGSVLGRVVSKTGQRSDYRANWQLNKGTPNFDPEVKTFYYDDGTPYTAKGVYVEFPGLNISDAPVWIKLPERMTTIPEAGVIVMVERSNDDTNVPQIAYVIEEKGSKNIMPNGTREITNVGDDYATSYGDNRSISYGKSSSTNLDAAISQIDGEYATGDFKSASYSIGGGYSYSESDNGQSGVLSKSYAAGNTYSESYADETTSYSKVGSSDNTSYVDSSVSFSKMGSQKDTTHIDTQVRESTIGATTDSSAIGASNSNSVVGVVNSNAAQGVVVDTSVVGATTRSSATGASNTNSAVGANNENSATGVSLRLSAIGSSTEISAIGTSSSITVYGDQTRVETKNGVNVEAKPAEVDARLKGTIVQIVSEIDVVI